MSPNISLGGITTTGGRLDVAAVTKAVQNLCGGAPTGPLEILWIGPNPVETTLKARFQVPTYTTYQVRVFNGLGQQLFEGEYTPDPFGVSTWEYDAGLLPKGVYTLSLGRGDKVRSEKFVKK